MVLESKPAQRMIETAPTAECQERVRKRSGDGCEQGPIPIWSIEDERERERERNRRSSREPSGGQKTILAQ